MLARSGSRNSARLSVCLSVTRVFYDKTKRCTADILVLYVAPSLCHIAEQVVIQSDPKNYALK